MANRTYEESSVWRCLKLDERAVDTRDSDSARGDGGVETCCAKSEEKGRTAEERKAEEEETEEVEGKTGGGGRGKWGMRGGS